MRSPFPILFWIAFYCLLSFSLAHAQASTRQDVIPESESDSLNEWKELLCWTSSVPKADGECSLGTLGSTMGDNDSLLSRPSWEALLQCAQELFNPAHIAERFRGSISRAVNWDNFQSTDSPHDGSDRLKRAFETLLFEESSKMMSCFETMINSVVDLSIAFNSATSSNDHSPNSLLKKLAKLVANVRDDFSTRFPLPATALGHASRVERASRVFDQIQRVVVRLAKSHEIEQEVIERYIARVRPFPQDLGVLIGDVSELYPGAVEALVLNLSGLLLPEAAFVRSLVILYCFGPYVLGKDAISGWLLKHVLEAFKIV